MIHTGSIARIRILRSIFSIGALAVVAAWGSQAIARDLIVAIRSEPTSMDPQYHALTSNIQFSQTLFEPLIRNDADLQLRPALAESWSADGNTWTIHLRPDVKFSDGSPFTAEDVVFTFNRVPLVPNSPSSYVIYTQKITHVEAVDPLTVRITTESPYPLLPNNLAGLPIMSAQAASGPAPEGKTTTQLNAGEGLVGTGPYRFVSWRRGSEIVFERNPHYWGPSPAWDTVTYRFITNPAARVAALLAGDVDLIEDPPTDDLPRLRNDANIRIVEKASNRVIYIALDQHGEQTPGISGTNGKNPLLDARVREAMSLAVDRQAIVDRIMGGVATPAAQLLPYPMFGTSEALTHIPPADVNRAKALLAQAGYPNGFTLVLGSPNGRYINDSRVAQALAAMWSRVGITTTVDATAPSVFFKKRDGYEFSAYLAGWATTTGEMSNTLNALLVTPDIQRGLGTTNRSRYSNPAMDALVEQASTEMDDAKRAELLRQANEMAMADYAMLPIQFEQSVWAMKADITYPGRVDQMTLVQEASLAK